LQYCNINNPAAATQHNSTAQPGWQTTLVCARHCD